MVGARGAACCSGIEALTLDLVFASLAVGAVVGAVVAAFGAPVLAQVLAAVVVALLTLFAAAAGRTADAARPRAPTPTSTP